MPNYGISHIFTNSKSDTCKTTNFAENLVPDFITAEISDDLRNLAEAGSILDNRLSG